jgi:hypothetical protein
VEPPVVCSESYEREVEGRYFGRGKEHDLHAEVRRLTGSDGKTRYYVSTEHAGRFDTLDFENEEQVRFLIRSRGWQKVAPPPPPVASN